VVVHSGSEVAQAARTLEAPRVIGEAVEVSGDGHLPEQEYDLQCGSCFEEYGDILEQCVDEAEVEPHAVVAGSGRAMVFCQGSAQVVGSTALAQASLVQRKRCVGVHSNRWSSCSAQVACALALQQQWVEYEHPQTR
jgi:hypothetical protein